MKEKKKEKKREKKREEEGKKRAHMAVRGVLVQWEVVPQAKLAAGVAMFKKKLVSLVYKKPSGPLGFLGYCARPGPLCDSDAPAGRERILGTFS